MASACPVAGAWPSASKNPANGGAKVSPETAFAIERGIISLPPLFFRAPSCCDISIRPLPRPFNLASRDNVVGPTWLLPVTDRRAQCRAAIVFRKRPFGWAERRHHLIPAAASAQVAGDPIFIGHIEDARREFARQIFHALKDYRLQDAASEKVRRVPTSISRWKAALPST